MNIRFIKKDEIDDLVELCRLHAEYEQSAYTSSGKKEKLLSGIFDNPPQLYCLVACIEEQIIGYATYMTQYSTWDACNYIYMDCLFIKQDFRSLGIGPKLVDRIIEEAKKLNCSLIQWQTPDFNTRAIKFYKRIGAFSKSKERFFLEVK